MNFLERILAGLAQAPQRTVLQEAWADHVERATAGELRALVAHARDFLRRTGLAPGDRCVLLGANSIRWVAMDLAVMAEGLVRVPLYTRQAPEELVTMMRDCGAALVVCGDARLQSSVCAHWPAAPAHLLDTDCGPAATADAPAPTPAAAATPATSPTSTTPPTAPPGSTVAPATPPAPRRADEHADRSMCCFGMKQTLMDLIFPRSAL